MGLIDRLSQSAAVLGALLVASSAQAVVIADAVYSVSLTHHEFFPTDPEIHKSQTFSGPGSYSFPGISAVRGAVEGEAGVIATAHAAALFQQKSQSNASVSYSFEITGPAEGVQVPLLVTTILEYRMAFDNFIPSENESNPGIPGYVYGASATANVVNFANGSVSVSCFKDAHASPFCTPPKFSGSLAVTAQTGVVNQLAVTASANVDGTNNSAGITIDAFADPMIAFAPGLDATGYSILLSPGVANTLAVPEPSILVLSALGLVLLGLAARRSST